MSPVAPRTLRVLLVEHCPSGARRTTRMLQHGLPDTVVHHVPDHAGARAVVQHEVFDVALVDLGLPDATGLTVLRGLRDAGPAVGATIALTSTDEDPVVDAALAVGVQDHLVKEGLTPQLLARSIRYAVSRARAERDAVSSRRWAQGVLDSLESPTCALDAVGTIVAVNAAWTRFGQQNGGDTCLTGVGVDYLSVCERSTDPVAQACAGDLRELLQTGTGRVELDYPCVTPSGTRWFSLRANPVLGGGGAVLTHVDVTALRQAHDQLDFAASHDPLTGLVNRPWLTQELDRRLLRVEPGHVVAVFLIDLDRFQLINDTLGHAAGDSVLVRVGQELSAAVRQGDVVARHDGAAFVVLAAARDLEVPALADRLLAATRTRLAVDGVDVDVSASLGLALSHGTDGDTAEDVLRAVDDAMQQAKAAGRGCVQLDTEDLRARARARAQLFRELQSAIDHEQFVLHFQPIVVPDVGGIHAVEALIRWQHPERGLLAPGQFLDVAEATGLMAPIGAWVIRAACEHGQRLHEAGMHLGVTVNLSAKQLNDPGTVGVLFEALSDTGFSPHSLIVEVTETSMIDDTDTALSSMRAIKALGVQLAVDDFGTGYSSLAYLKRYPVDGLKIDRSFVRDILTDSGDRAIVTSLLRLARDLDLWVVAEGVETLEQQQALQASGCELIQGFYYARPMPAEDLPASALRLAERAAVSAPQARRLPGKRAEVDTVDTALVTRMAVLRAGGASLTSVAAALNAEGHRTALGLRWHPRSVARALDTRASGVPADSRREPAEGMAG